MANILYQNVKSAFCLKSQTKYFVCGTWAEVSFLPSLLGEIENLHSAERFRMVILLLRLRSSSNVFASNLINHYVKNSQLKE